MQTQLQTQMAEILHLIMQLHFFFVFFNFFNGELQTNGKDNMDTLQR